MVLARAFITLYMPQNSNIQVLQNGTKRQDVKYLNDKSRTINEINQTTNL